MYPQQQESNTMAPLDLVPYQVDYSSKNVGKTVANTKKKVEFKFGFANNDAVAHGQKGVECRGVEHKVVLKWSLTSGKTVVECDTKEIHFGMSGNKVRKRCRESSSMMRNLYYSMISCLILHNLLN